MSEVYFTDMRVPYGGPTLPEKLKKLIRKGGIANIDMKGKYVAIKMHFGEPGNIAYLRPHFARAVADVVKELGGRPFLVDCNTLYTGLRHNGLDHLDAAEINGFNTVTTGCHVVIGDGIKGTDEVIVPVKGGELVKNAHIGRAVADADVIISLAHFKGHEGAGFGGTLKNLGMGCGSITGKRDQHSGSKPQVDQTKCIGCHRCTTQCAHSAISFIDGKATIDHGKCVGCDRCMGVCPVKAIAIINGNANEILNKKIVEYAKAVVQDKPAFYINIVMDVSPNCDCHPENDGMIIPDVGMFCSADPIAIDVACADMCNKQPVIANSALGESEHKLHDYFCDVHPETDWRVQITHGEKIGLGSSDYKLVVMK